MSSSRRLDPSHPPNSRRTIRHGLGRRGSGQSACTRSPGYQSGVWVIVAPNYRTEPTSMSSNPRKSGSPNEHPLIRWRNQGGKLRAYAELRSLGGGRRALIPPGETRATTDPETAEILVHQYIAELSQRKHKKALPAIDPGPDLVDVAIRYLDELAASNHYDAETLADWEAHLSRVVDYFTRWQHASVHHPEPRCRADGASPRSVSWISTRSMNG